MACRAVGISPRTYERWRKHPEGDKRRGPTGPLPHQLTGQERSKIIEICCSPEFRDRQPRHIVPILADRGIYVASESSFYRVLRKERLLTHRNKSNPPKHSRPKELIAYAPNQLWSWDITYLRTTVLGIFFYLYLVIDIYSRKITGYELADHESSELSSKMIERICRSEGVDRHQLFIHADNGGPMKGATMLATLKRLGVIPSFSRPSVSNDNAYSEALFKTLKYHPAYPNRPFESIEEARAWVENFIDWYNNQHLHSGINFVTPASRHRGEDVLILARRKRVYELAQEERPERWSGKARNWSPQSSVKLNATNASLAAEASLSA